MNTIKKLGETIKIESANRGTYFTAVMLASHLKAAVRGSFYKILYFRNVHCSVFSLQSNSKIEIFSKHSRAVIGKFVFIRKNVSIRIDHEGVLVLGEKVFINDNCTINCVNNIIIGKNTKIAPNVCINDHDHNYKNVSDQRLLKGEVIIGENVWIGSNVVVLRNTYIGNNAVIAAGSVVKGNIPADTMFFNKREEMYVPFSNLKKKGELS